MLLSAWRRNSIRITPSPWKMLPLNWAFFKRLVDALPKGCKIILTVPANQSLWSKHDETAHHFRRYEENQLPEIWSGLDVRPIFVSFYNSRLYPIVRTVRAMTKALGLTAGKENTDFSLPPLFLNEILIRLFSGEARRLVKLIVSPGARPYTFGVSLIAVLEKYSCPQRQAKL